MKNFKNKVALITGAGSGIGRALAIQLADSGCNLALVDWNEKTLKETEEIIRKKNVAVALHPFELREKEKIQYGYVVKIGPGYPIPLPLDDDEPWKSDEEKVKYVPLQVKEGDLAVFLQGGAYEVMYQNEKYFIVPQSSILMIERDDSLFS